MTLTHCCSESFRKMALRTKLWICIASHAILFHIWYEKVDCFKNRPLSKQQIAIFVVVLVALVWIRTNLPHKRRVFFYKLFEPRLPYLENNQTCARMSMQQSYPRHLDCGYRFVCTAWLKYGNICIDRIDYTLIALLALEVGTKSLLYDWYYCIDGMRWDLELVLLENKLAVEVFAPVVVDAVSEHGFQSLFESARGKY